MSRSLTTLAFLLAVALTAALLVPALTNWDEERASLEATIAEVIGGPVTLEGDVSVRLLPSPRLTAARVSLRDADGRLSVSGANIRAEIALWPLMLNKVVVTRIVLAGGEINLDGDAASLRVLGDDMATRLSLGEGRFRYLVAPETMILGSGDAALILHQPHFELWSDGDATLIRFAARALEDEALKADVTFRPQAEGPWRVDWRATYLDDVVEIRGIGELERFYSGASFVGDYTILADDIDRLLDPEAPVKERSVTDPAISLDIRGPFRAAGSDWFIDPSQITLGTMQAVIELQAQTNNGLHVSGRGQSTLADLDALGVDVAKLRDFFVRAGLAGADTTLPSWFSMSFDLNADGLMLNRRVVRDLDADFLLRDGTFNLNTFAARLPGGTEVRYYPRRDRARGLSVSSSSSRNLLDWLDVDVSNIGAEYLQELELDAAISEGPGPLHIEVVTLVLDGGQASGIIERNEAGALNIQGEFVGLNLDAYSPSDLSGSFIDRVQALGDLIGTSDGAGFDLTGEDVTLAGAALGGFHLSAATEDGVLRIEEAQMDFANSGHLSASGHVARAGGNLQLALEGDDVDPGLFEGLPVMPGSPTDLQVTLADQGSGLVLEGSVLADGLEIAFEGQRSTPEEGEIITGQMTARSAEPGALASALGLGIFASDQSDEQLVVQWNGPRTDGELELNLELGGLSAQGSGRVSDIFNETSRLDMNVEGQASSLSHVLVQMGGPLESDLDAMSFAASGRLTRDETGLWRFQSASSHAGAIPLAMDLRRRVDETSALTGAIRLGSVTLGGEATQENAIGSLVWSTELYDLEWMNDLRASLNIAIDRLNVGNIAFDDVGFHMEMADHNLTIDQARGTLDGGLLTGSGRIARAGTALSVSLEIAGEGLPVEPVFALGRLPQMDGDMTLSVRVAGRGRSPFDLIANLDGRLDFDIGEGEFATINMGLLEDQLGEVRTRIALRELANQSVRQGSTEFARLAGTVPMDRGVLDVSGMEGIAETGAFSLEGSIDLRSQIVDVETSFLINVEIDEKDPLPAIVTFRGVGGQLSTAIDVTRLQEGIADQLADTRLELLSEDDLPEDLQELLQAYEEAFEDVEPSSTTP